MINKDIKQYLKNFDKEKKSLVEFHGEYDISKKIKGFLKDKTPSKEDISEQIAFDFLPDYPDKNEGWQTYYGPMFVLPNDKGQMIEYPSIKKINEEMLVYWTKRANECNNPILSSRYADLVIDFSPKIINKNADIKLFQIVIDSNIKICEKLLVNSLDCITKIKRALILAIQANDKKQISNTKNTILKLENMIAVDNKPGLWGFAFKWLILDFSKKILLEEKEKTDLIKTIEERLKRVEDSPLLVESATSLLAEYYSSIGDENNLMRVLGVLEKILKSNVKINSEALLKINAYEQLAGTHFLDTFVYDFS